MIAEEEAELRLTRKDGEFDGTEAQWRELSDNQQFSLALAAVNRRWAEEMACCGGSSRT